MILKHNLRAVFVAALALGLVSCGEDSDENTAQNGVDGESSVGEQTASIDVLYSAANFENGVSYGDISIGDPDAPVTIIEYASFTCSHCASFHNNVLPIVKRDYIETGKVRLLFRNFVRDQYDLTASMISRCNPPEKAFAVTSLFYSRQHTWLNEDYFNNLASLARRAGMSRASVDTCITNAELQNNLIEMNTYGSEVDNVTGTPTFFINGVKLTGPTPETFFEALNDAL